MWLTSIIASFPDEHYERTAKGFRLGAPQFSFFSGSGNVHKGLDVLLDAFSLLDTHLYICQKISPAFYKVYRHELEDLPNIHLVGFVPIRSQRYYDLIDRCAFVIHPSCAEGSAGSLVEAMHQGLIPVVTRETTVDTGDYGVTLDNGMIQHVAKMVDELSQKSPQECKHCRDAPGQPPSAEFSVEAFESNLKNAIAHIISQNRRGGQ